MKIQRIPYYSCKYILSKKYRRIYNEKFLVKSKKLFFRQLKKITPYVAVDDGNIRLFISTHDRAMSQVIWVFGSYQKYTFLRAAELAQRYMPRSGRMLIDVGANIGTTTIYALDSGLFSQVIAFEPSPENVKTMRINLIANDMEDRVNLHMCALSDKTGHVRFELSPVNFGDHRVRVDDADSKNIRRNNSYCSYNETNRNVITVESRTLDNVFQQEHYQYSDVALVWMDCQGHEAHILNGSSDLLNENIPVVCEFWPYGLVLAGAYERFVDIVREKFTHFLDIQRLDMSDPEINAVQEFEKFGLRFSGTLNYTDVMFFKL